MFLCISNKRTDFVRGYRRKCGDDLVRLTGIDGFQCRAMTRDVCSNGIGIGLSQQGYDLIKRLGYVLMGILKEKSICGSLIKHSWLAGMVEDMSASAMGISGSSWSEGVGNTSESG